MFVSSLNFMIREKKPSINLDGFFCPVQRTILRIRDLDADVADTSLES
jgi:hypothetical protein